MIEFLDIHTHHIQANNKSIVSVSPTQFTPITNTFYSVGIHPWDSENATQEDIALLQEVANHKQVVAIGETGADRLRGGCIDNQISLLELHIKLSESLQKPLILHAVRTIDIILAMHRKYNPTQQWIIHGYRGNKSTAQQLINKGIDLSFNTQFNRETIVATPLDKLWIETDDNIYNIETLYSEIAKIKEIELQLLCESIYNRGEKLFFQPQ